MYEYKVVPAPMRTPRVKGLKTTADRFAHLLAERINAEAAGGWRFVRTETLPCEERKGLVGTRVTSQTMMIFARPLGQARPDAGAALAAVQGMDRAAAHHPAPAPAPAYAALDAAQDVDHAHDDGYQEPSGRMAYAPDAHDPRGWQDDEAPALPDTAPHSSEAEPARDGAFGFGRRQEPLFRAGALLRGDESAAQTRAEPLLRPRLARDPDSSR